MKGLMLWLQVQVGRLYCWANRMKAVLKARKSSRGWLFVTMGQAGEFGVNAVVSLAVGMMLIGAVVVALWDKIADTDTAIQALTGVDEGTTFLQGIWPIIIMFCAFAIGIGVIMWVLRKMDII